MNYSSCSWPSLWSSSLLLQVQVGIYKSAKLACIFLSLFLYEPPNCFCLCVSIKSHYHEISSRLDQVFVRCSSFIRLICFLFKQNQNESIAAKSNLLNCFLRVCGSTFHCTSPEQHVFLLDMRSSLYNMFDIEVDSGLIDAQHIQHQFWWLKLRITEQML